MSRSTKKKPWTHNEDSDQPDQPSSLNRIIDSSCVVIMSVFVFTQTANTTEIGSAWRMCNNVVFVVLRLTCYICYVIS